MKTAADFQCLSIDRAMAYVGTEAGVLTLMPALQQSLITDLARIEQSLAASDLPQVRNCLHQLKGFIPVFCTDALVAHVAALETLSRHADIEAVRIAYGRLAPQLAQLQTEVDGYMNSPP
jgi:HPt (histidine-containing phosphotransfer) domain-containing protein